MTPQLCDLEKNPNAKIINDKIRESFNPDFNIKSYFKFNPSLIKLNDDILLMSYRIYFGKLKGCKEFDLQKCHYWDNGWNSELWNNKDNLSLNYTGISKVDAKTLKVIEDTVLIQHDRPSGFEDIRLFEYNDVVYQSGIAITGFNKFIAESNKLKGKKDSKGMVTREMIETYGKKEDILSKLPPSFIEIEYNCKNLHKSNVEKNWFGYTNKNGEHIMINPTFGSFFPLKQSVIDFNKKRVITNNKWTDGSVENFKEVKEYDCKEYPEIKNTNFIDEVNKAYSHLVIDDGKNKVFIRLSGGSWGISYDTQVLFIGHVVVDLTRLDIEKVKKYIKEYPDTQISKNLFNLLYTRSLGHPAKFNYFQIFFTIDEEKNEITKISNAFNVFQNRERDTGINFPMGLVNIGDKYLISYGESDYKAIILTMNKSEIEKLFKYEKPEEFKMVTFYSSGETATYDTISEDQLRDIDRVSISGFSDSGVLSGAVKGGTRSKRNHIPSRKMQIKFIY